MSRADRQQIPSSLPLTADPAAGTLTGMFLLAAVLAEPVGWVLALIVWAVMTWHRTEDRDDGRPTR
jgi:hypothetical protein